MARAVATTRATTTAATARAAAADARIEVRKTYKLYIGGAFPRSESGRSYLVSAADGTPLANAVRSSRKDVRDAVRAARTAFHGWAKKTAMNRGQVLYRVAELMEGRRDQFVAEVAAAEGLRDARATEAVDRAVDGLARLALSEPLGRNDFSNELVAPALHELRDPVEDLATVHRGLGRPTGGRGARGPDRVTQVLARRAAGVGQRRTVGRRDEVRPTRLGPRERAADVELVGLAYLDPGRLRSRRGGRGARGDSPRSPRAS